MFFSTFFSRVVCLFWLGVFAMSMPVHADEPMKLNYLRYPPLSWEQDGEMRGIMVDILNEALHARMGITLQHTEFPWARAQQLVADGLADGFTTVPTPERREYTDISREPVVVVNITMFTWKGFPDLAALNKVKTIEDLNGFKLVDYLGSGWAKQNLKGLDVHWVPGFDTALEMLARGRRDVFVQNSLVTHYSLRRLGLDDRVIEVPNALSTVTFNLCIGKQSPYASVLPAFDDTLKAMQMDGTMDAIYARYH